MRLKRNWAYTIKILPDQYAVFKIISTFVNYFTTSYIIMKPSHIEHIGIAVKSLDEAIPFYEKMLGTSCYAVEEVKDQKVRTAFLKIGQTKIELLESTEPDGPIGKYIEKRGEGIHHIAYAVEDIESHLKEAEENGIRLIDQQPRNGAEGLQIAFLHPKSTFGVLTEFCEDKNQ